jgi:polyisoprenoid-binding protein YceI
MIGFSNLANAQAIYKIQDSKDVAMKISGTSTVKDWDMDVKSAAGEAQFVFKTGSESELKSVESLTFALKVKDLQNDSKKLNKHAYEALEADEFKKIQYKLSSSTISPEKGGYLLKTKGKLTVKAVTNNIVMDVNLMVNKNGTITLKGSYNMNMKDYKVDPPTYLFGTIKTGEAITLDFSVDYKI